MDRDGLSEQAAFDFLQKTAMTSRRAMRVVADEVLAGTLSPSEPGTGD
jgi:AmiR/NasT family two-component response regulator